MARERAEGNLFFGESGRFLPIVEAVFLGDDALKALASRPPRRRAKQYQAMALIFLAEHFRSEIGTSYGMLAGIFHEYLELLSVPKETWEPVEAVALDESTGDAAPLRRGQCRMLHQCAGSGHAERPALRADAARRITQIEEIQREGEIVEAITSEEIAAVVEGAADRATRRRVAAAALVDPGVRARLGRLRTIESAPARVAEDDGSFALRALRLKEAMEIATRRVARERREEYTPARAGPQAAASTPSPIVRVRLALQVARQAVTLPCLAPATASSVAELGIRRDLFLTGDVRIELQQLPGEPPVLRAFGDASNIPGGFAVLDADTLELTLDGVGQVSIPLNDEGRGYADFTIGTSLPAPRGPVSLTAAALVRRR